MGPYKPWLICKSKRGGKQRGKLLGNPYLKALLRLRRTIPEWDNFFDADAVEQRPQNWVRLDVVGSAMQRKNMHGLCPTTVLSAFCSNFHRLLK